MFEQKTNVNFCSEELTFLKHAYLTWNNRISLENTNRLPEPNFSLMKNFGLIQPKTYILVSMKKIGLEQ